MSKSATELAHMIERYNAGVHSQAIFEDYLEAAKMLRTQHKQIEQLREALQALYDEQNGPPLIRDAAGWEAAMELASKALEGK